MGGSRILSRLDSESSSQRGRRRRPSLLDSVFATLQHPSSEVCIAALQVLSRISSLPRDDEYDCYVVTMEGGIFGIRYFPLVCARLLELLRTNRQSVSLADDVDEDALHGGGGGTGNHPTTTGSEEDGVDVQQHNNNNNNRQHHHHQRLQSLALRCLSTHCCCCCSCSVELSQIQTHNSPSMLSCGRGTFLSSYCSQLTAR